MKLSMKLVWDLYWTLFWISPFSIKLLLLKKINKLFFLILLLQISLLLFQQKIDSRLKSRVSVAARLLHSHRETHHTTLRDALMQCSTFEPHLFNKKCSRTMSTLVEDILDKLFDVEQSLYLFQTRNSPI